MLHLLVLVLLSLSPEPVFAELGQPVTVEYDIPEGWSAGPLEEADGAWNLLGQEGARVSLVPLSMDTLALPPMIASLDTSFILVQSPTVIVTRTMPDTSWTVAPFPAPLTLDIPPGFPLDYLHMHRFWLDWGPPPGPGLLLPLVAVLAVMAVLFTFILLRTRRKRMEGGSDAIHETDGSGITPAEEAMALLETPAFAAGDWPVYFREVDRLLRITVSTRFGVSNPALTWGQVRRMLRREEGGAEFVDASAELSREILLQRYAGWGGSRDRARKYTRTLASIREAWHR